MKQLIAVVAVLVLATTAQAQGANATPTNKLTWNEVGQNAAYAQAAIYNVYADASATPVALAGVTCVAAGADAACSAPFPAFTPGPHTITLTQAVSTVEAPKSLPLSFTFVVVVTPTGLSIK